ncbi:hypothetical protein D9615_010364 [Tricholomella constricta]|uniref:Uncharacterized protein n=1 Tax=Tricholomella constricta TaxID=117010 RepID=A0A8H5GP80_9AGAR|nr:hypothetical protein D9615_010364 [Tricholomella constricta]
MAAPVALLSPFVGALSPKYWCILLLTRAITPQFIGNLLNYALMGVLAMQVYFYTLTFQEDRLAIKSLVYLVFVLDIIQTCFSTHYFWQSLVDGWGDTSPAIAAWSLGTLTPLAGSIAFIVQSFFAWRIWVLRGSRWPLIQTILVIVILV